MRMFCARRDVGAVNYGFRECLVVCLDPTTRARHRILGADNAMELAHPSGGQLTYKVSHLARRMYEDKHYNSETKTSGR